MVKMDQKMDKTSTYSVYIDTHMQTEFSFILSGATGNANEAKQYAWNEVYKKKYSKIKIKNGCSTNAR